LEDKLVISGTVPESVSLDNYLISAFFTHSPSLKHPALCSQNDEDFKIVVGNDIDQIVLDESKDVLLVIYHPMYHPDLPMKTTNNLAKLLRDINSLVIAKMNGATNWHPRAKLRLLEFFKILFYPAGRKRFEPIAFEGSSSADVVEYYKFIKKHAGIPFEPISALEQVSPDHGATETEIEEPPRLP